MLSMNQLVFYSERHTRGRSTGRDTVAVLFLLIFQKLYMDNMGTIYE